MIAPLHVAPVAYLIITAVCMVSVFALRNRSFFEACRMHPYALYRGKRLATVVTSLFVHVNEKHLLINAGLLFLALPEVEYMLVDDFGALMGRLLVLAFILFSAAFAGLFTAIQHRSNARHRSAGASALIMALVLFFLMYFPVEPLNVGPSILPLWLPMWLALGMIVFMLLFALLKIPAGAIHLYGALAGILFAFAVRPQAAIEIAEIICPQWKLEKGNDETPWYKHASEHPVDGPVEECPFAPFAALDGV
ncbi:rhomboid family intramembrane serine protease [Parapedobacter sp. GCM10030251]|uniref:rhomboid family intramembrane serine protease n=1 Tax=Parapedobacter sp. GCM10030251 TaxID=3273419 RepID=UPI0036155879